ncbi:hypothetical protein H920_11357 [Fukomys damarensis]|uniref:Uncharacterized protein n=1 Tax=Fukomys damarensis TaxID=885580 RepID=A0A091D9X9_FUKDA|nr:hypothetical protein H920_11357 [Fukomys damarensis]
MASSSPSSDPSDAEDFNRENKSTLKLPGDCLPSKELPSCKEIILLEDMTPTVGSSGDLIRPVQGRWGPEGKKRWSDLQQLPLNDPKQIGKPGASVAWADNNGFEESAAHEKQCRGKKCPKHKTNRARRTLDGLVKRLNGYQSLDWDVEEIEDEEIYNHEKLQRKKDEDCDFLKLTMAEDLRRSNCLPAQLSHQEHEVRLESAMRKPSGNTDVGPFPELPGTPKGQERAEKQCRGKKCPKHKTNRARRALDGLVKRLNGYQSLDWDVEEIEDEEIYNHEKLQRKKDEDCDFLKLTMAEDLRRSNCLPAQLSHQEHEVRLESAMRKPSGNTDVGPFPELPGTPKGQERAEKQCRGKKCPKHKTNRARRILDGLVKLLNAFQSLDWNVEGIEDEEIYNYEKLQRKKDEDCDFLELTMAEDLRRSNCLPAQLSHQEHEVRLESAMRKPSGNTDVGPFPELPGTPKGQERAEKQCSGKKCPKQKTNRARRILDGLVKLLNAFQSLDWNVEGIEDEEIYNYEKLQRKKDEDCDFLEHTMVEDLRRSNCLPAQLSHQEHEMHLESAMRKPSGNTDVGPFPELPGTPKGQERAERAGEASSSRKSGTTEPSTSSAHLEDDTPRPPGTASRLVGRAFRWLHQIAVPRGCSPEQATRSCPQRAPRGSGWLRGKRVPPDGPPGQFRPHEQVRLLLLNNEEKVKTWVPGLCCTAGSEQTCDTHGRD